MAAGTRPGLGRRVHLARGRPEAAPGSRRRRPSRTTVLSVALAVMLLGVAAWIAYGTTLLGVREIAVSGSQIAGPDAVRAAAAVAAGTPLARVDTDEVADRVRTLPSVADVEVSRSWPHTLVIEVTERTAVAVVAGPDGFAVLSADGVVFNRVTAPPAGTVVLRLDSPGPGDPSTVAALRVVAALTPPLRAALRELVAESPARLVLNLADGRVIRWGDAERSDIKATVATALLDRPGRTIDVTVPDVATIS